MTSEEKLARTKLAIETKLKRTDQALARRQFELAEAQFAWQRTQATQAGWRVLVSPTGIVVTVAALGLLGTAGGKYGDYLTTKRQQETTIILKASEVSPALSPEDQDKQRARNLLWFSEARYIELPAKFVSQLTTAAKLQPGQTLPPPVVQSQPSASASELLAKTEGLRKFAQKFLNGQQIIGFGHLLTPQEIASGEIRVGNEAIPIANGITDDQAGRLLKADLASRYASVDQLVKVPLTPPQRDALAAVIYQTGEGRLRASKMLKDLNQGNYEAVPQGMRDIVSPLGASLGAADVQLWTRPANPNPASQTQQSRGASQ